MAYDTGTKEKLSQLAMSVMSGSNRAIEDLRANPRKYSIGAALSDGRIGGFLPDNIRKPLGEGINSAVPIDLILGGSAQGKPLDVLQGGGNLIMTAAAGGAFSPKALFNQAGLSKVTPTAKTTPRQLTRDALGKFSKSGGKNMSETYGQMRARLGVMDRPPHQVAIEQAINSGDYNKALQIAQQIAPGDPYRDSMVSFAQKMLGR